MRACLMAVVLVAGLGCAAGGGSKTSGSSGAGGEGSGAGGPGGSGLGGNFGAGGGGGSANFNTEVFGHSADVLYRLDPTNNEVTVVAAFNGCDNVVDIAIDKDSNIFATSYQGLHRIDKNTANCTLIASGPGFPNSLSFVPEGTLLANEEALVGYANDQYVHIDTITGQMSTVGSIGSGYSSSGDIVSVKDGPTYLTAYRSGDCFDCLVEVNPATGALVDELGPVGYSQVFGLGFWGGTVFGFTQAGELFALSIGPNGLNTTPITIPNAPAGLQFWGAGSSTNVPVTPPE